MTRTRGLAAAGPLFESYGKEEEMWLTIGRV